MITDMHKMALKNIFRGIRLVFVINNASFCSVLRPLVAFIEVIIMADKLLLFIF